MSPHSTQDKHIHDTGLLDHIQTASSSESSLFDWLIWRGLSWEAQKNWTNKIDENWKGWSMFLLVAICTAVGGTKKSQIKRERRDGYCISFDFSKLEFDSILCFFYRDFVFCLKSFPSMSFKIKIGSTSSENSASKRWKRSTSQMNPLKVIHQKLSVIHQKLSVILRNSIITN